MSQFVVASIVSVGCVMLLGGGGISGIQQWTLLIAAVGSFGFLLSELSQLAEANEELRRCIDESHRKSVEINDLVLRRVGVELHDGPAQLIGLALLRLGALCPDKTATCNDYERIRSALEEALAEIRNVSAGLSVPELERVSPGEALRLAARNHERRTATTVTCEVDDLPQHISPTIKLCLYRFAQEALNNAYRHAGGRGQVVRGAWRDRTLVVEVVDDGPGFEPESRFVGNHLGLTAMRDRVVSLGGTLEIISRPGAGTRLTTRFEIGDSGCGQEELQKWPIVCA